MSESKSLEPPTESAGTPKASTPWRDRFLPRTPQEIAITLCALSLVAAFCCPWVVSGFNSYSGATLYRIDKPFKILWLIPVLALATVERLKNLTLCRRLGTATAVITWLYLGYVQVKLRPYAMAWGESLTDWLAFALFVSTGQLRRSSLLDLAAKKLSSRKGEVYGHSGSFTSDFHFSAKEFYTELESAIRAKEWPGVQLFHIDYTEAGLLSHKREYLRVIRQRHIFDICASTFGKDYFFSVREAELPAVVDIRAFIVVLLTLYFVTMTFIQRLGFVFGSLAMMFLLVFVIWLLFNILKLGLTRLDSMLIQLPVIGPIYEAWFRRDTYFQQDSRLVFLQAVTELVKDHVMEAASGNGVKLLSCFEYQPILDGLYTRTRIDVSEQDPTAPKK